ncbi:MAG: DUF4114 domain-containing protein [Saprospiraceae bacterium]
MFNRSTKNLAWVFVCCLLAQSCAKDDISTPKENNSESTAEVQDDYFTSEGNDEGFEDRITFSNKIIRWENLNEFTAGSAEARTETDYDDMYWLHVGDVKTLKAFGNDLSATHIDFMDDKAFISYHKRGSDHIGGIEVIDLSDPNEPKSIFRKRTKKADMNSVTVGKNENGDGVKVWMAMSDANKGAVLGELLINAENEFNGFSLVNLSNHIGSGITSSANAVSRSGEYLYVSSGKTNGGAFCLNASDLSVIGGAEFQNGKYIDVNGVNGLATKVVSLQTGEESTIRIADVGSFDFAEEFPVGSILHQNVDEIGRGKSVMHFVENNPDEVYITAGMEGLKRVNINSGETTWTSPSDMITSGNTNGVTSDGEFIYAANGADGMTIFTQPEFGGDPERIFQWDMDDAVTASANMIATHGEWVFVAKGQAGVKILKRPQPGDYLPIDSYNGQGVPDNLVENEETCPTLLSNIFTSALPEGLNIQQAHPEYFGDDVPSSIYIQEDAELRVTFLHEGAGYKNVLGYYYYNADNPPSSVEDIQKLIVFPNASAQGSGGGLFEGNTVELLGSFKANTVVGFFLNANGWSNGNITVGNAAHYTDYEFNEDGKRQSVLMYDNTCGATVIGFEDILIPGGDKDYNDAIFQIRSYPETAIDHTTFIQL